MPHATTTTPPSATDDDNGSRPSPSSASDNRGDNGKNAASKNRKPRKNNASGGKSSLFWVHTDPESVSGGSREETLKRIRSHVMSEHNRKKRLENTKRYKSKTWKHLAFQPVETTATAAANTTTPAGSKKSPASSGSRKSSSPSSSSSASPLSSSSSPQQYKQNELAVTNAPSAVGNLSPPFTQAAQPFPGASPWSYVGHNANDAFCTTHTQLSGRMLRHLEYFLRDLTPMAYPLQRRHGPKIQAHWGTLVQHDPASLHASICVAATNAALMTGEFPMLDPNRQRTSVLMLDTFHHRGETIKLVNEGLSDPVKAASDELIAAVSILLTIEVASGNPDYIKIHLAGLRQMVALRNSFADVPPDVRFQISWTDIRVACMAFTKPIFPFVRYARPSHFSLTPPIPDLSITGSRLISLIEIPGLFDDALCKSIYDLLELTWYSEWIKGAVYREFDDEMETYFNSEVLYVEYSLHRDRFAETGEAKGDLSIGGGVRLACLLFHNTVIWDFYPNNGLVFPKPIIALRLALGSTIPTGCFSHCRDLLIWLLFIGACSSQHLFERSFFVTEMATAVRSAGIQSWQELRALLLGFFYVDRRYLAPLRGLWDEIHMVPIQV
ncbi:hypothetical protein ASPWEDRAFT_109774 [Aspergillus wentii DTO 134E9]|uniref:Tachykinin family protein n=1 Tax=Aspergillus wentii DTO 134E9 TaxID=1073089 RepID=A0A1L9RKX3_ASPWE|nr:uncharacterized protein ASPWEDRAFT_109774 [Aspergillus wentii DTO 134E9]OJJ35589.1 hypothetical protein ASPWEDRAFT_109774 [Aspergillus wentii DTO 134E9]